MCSAVLVRRSGRDAFPCIEVEVAVTAVDGNLNIPRIKGRAMVEGWNDKSDCACVRDVCEIAGNDQQGRWFVAIDWYLRSISSDVSRISFVLNTLRSCFYSKLA